MIRYGVEFGNLIIDGEGKEEYRSEYRMGCYGFDIAQYTDIAILHYGVVIVILKWGIEAVDIYYQGEKQWKCIEENLLIFI